MGIRGKLLLLAAGIAVPLVIVGTLDLRNMWRLSRSQLDDSVKRQVLMQLAESVPDLIISDIRMPGMDGYKLARQLRGSPRTALVPIVFLTAKDETADRISNRAPGQLRQC